jgi:hypothetical protein
MVWKGGGVGQEHHKSKKSNLARKIIREVLSLAFWLHALNISGLLHLPVLGTPELPRYIYNSLLVVFIVNYSLFTDNGWWSVIFDLIYLYFLPFIYVGRFFWWVLGRFYKRVKTKVVWQSPRLITARAIPVALAPKGETPKKGGAEVVATEPCFYRRAPRLVLKFAMLWSLLILTVNFRPFLALALVVTLIGAGKAIWGLWGLFSGGSSWVDKAEDRLAAKVKELVNQIMQWDETSTSEEITKAINGLKFYGSAFAFITENTEILSKWAFALSLFVSVPFYCYISFLFSCVYFGIGKIANLGFSFSNALVDSLFMPFAWSALPANVPLRFIAGLQATCVTVIGYNILFRHLGNRLDKITRAAVKLRNPFQDQLLVTKISRAESVLSNFGPGDAKKAPDGAG